MWWWRLKAWWRGYQQERRITYAAQLGHVMGGVWCPDCQERLTANRGLNLTYPEMTVVAVHGATCEKRIL
jgi:hypothetical protein